MILEYRRASTVEEAVSLLQRPNLLTLPLGGGTHLSTQKGRDFGVVDLQDLKFDRVEERGDTLSVGSTLSLDRLAQLQSIPAGLRKAIVHHQTVNLRQVSTVAGELIAADGRSPFCTAFLALDAQIMLVPSPALVSLESVLSHRPDIIQGQLIAEVLIPSKVDFIFDSISRTPQDSPIVCVAACRWPAGRLRVAVGGFGAYPTIIYDRATAEIPEEPVEVTLSAAGDEWASAEYRQAMANVLVRRAMQSLGAE